MAGSNAGTGQPLTLRCAKCKVRRNYRSDAHADMFQGTYLLRTGRTKPSPKKGGLRLLNELHEYACIACDHVGWSRHKQMMHKPLAHYVEIVEQATGKVDKRMGPMTESKAAKVASGVLMRINADFFVRVGTAESLAKEAARWAKKKIDSERIQAWLA